MFLSYNLPNSTSIKQSFSSVLLAFLFKLNTYKVSQNMFKINEVYVSLACSSAVGFFYTFYKKSCETIKSLYIVIVVTDVKDQILKNITCFPFLQFVFPRFRRKLVPASFTMALWGETWGGTFCFVPKFRPKRPLGTSSAPVFL